MSLGEQQRVALGGLQVRRHHLRDERVEADARLPAELGAGARRVAEQGIDLRRPEVAWVDADDAFSASDIDADFDGLLVDWKAKGHTVTFAGKEALPGGDTLKLQVKTRHGIERTLYLDATTYLDRRHTGYLTLPSGRRDVVIDFANWQDVNGVKFPFDITEDRTSADAPVQSLVVYTEKIEANVAMDDALFATPKAGGN